MEEVKFSDVKQKIVDALNKLPPNSFPGEGPMEIIDGFINIPIESSLSSMMNIGGPSIPAVAVVGVETGRIYHFAYKALVKD